MAMTLQAAAKRTHKEHHYQIDVMKLLFSVCIFLYHARLFAESGSPLREIANKWGWIGVHFFFMVSGLLMVNSFMSSQLPDECSAGKSSLAFVLRKFKAIAVPYYVAFLLSFIPYWYTTAQKYGNAYRAFKEMLFKSIPELLVIEMAGIRPIGINPVTWYISAMLIAMLPLYYLLIRKTDFFLYVFSPLASLGILGFFFNSATPFYDHNTNDTIINAGVLRAVCGICMGAVSWLLAVWLREQIRTHKQRLYLTLAEVLTETIFLWLWLSRTMDSRLLFPVLFLLPIILGIAFSGKSYAARLFRLPILRYCNSLSLAIYLNHLAARRMIQELSIFQECTFPEKILWMVGLTAGLCLLYYCTLVVIRFLTSKTEQGAA